MKKRIVIRNRSQFRNAIRRFNRDCAKQVEKTLNGQKPQKVNYEIVSK